MEITGSNFLEIVLGDQQADSYNAEIIHGGDVSIVDLDQALLKNRNPPLQPPIAVNVVEVLSNCDLFSAVKPEGFRRMELQ